MALCLVPSLFFFFFFEGVGQWDQMDIPQGQVPMDPYLTLFSFKGEVFSIGVRVLEELVSSATSAAGR